MSSHEANVRLLARVLSDISHTLETSDERERRVERCLELAREIIPAARCSLLEVQAGVVTLYVAPEEHSAGRDDLTSRLMRLYRMIAVGDEIGRSSEPHASLALPVMGLDEIIGVIRVECADTTYDAMHLRLLSVVATQLGAYLAMVRLQERDQQRARELEAAHDFQQVLTGVVGHDLRNPLAVISTVASNLLDTTTDPKQARSLERALRNVEHASRLIGDLIDVTESRVSGQIRVAAAQADYCSIVEQTIGDLRQAHGSRTIELDVPDNRAMPGTFDPTRVSQIISNLVNNAAIHGEPSLPIQVRLMLDDQHAVITVRNWGPPIPASLLPTIFDPFKQGAPDKRVNSARGLGLGLYIVSTLARSHGGTVEVESSVEAGTKFTVRLPCQSKPHEAARGDGALVLIVDDDEDIRTGMIGLLEKRGYAVASATDGLDALRQLRAGLCPDLILLDYSMPTMNGEEFCDYCALDPQLAAIPVVIVSADTASAVKLAQAKARALLTKPVPIDKLLATIASIH